MPPIQFGGINARCLGGMHRHQQFPGSRERPETGGNIHRVAECREVDCSGGAYGANESDSGVNPCTDWEPWTLTLRAVAGGAENVNSGLDCLLGVVGTTEARNE